LAAFFTSGFSACLASAFASFLAFSSACAAIFWQSLQFASAPSGWS
jgi:hypothetical protein